MTAIAINKRRLRRAGNATCRTVSCVRGYCLNSLTPCNSLTPKKYKERKQQ